MAIKGGLYVHIPFCKRKCTYCNFHFSTNFTNLDVLFDTLKWEIVNRSAEAKSYTIQSLYFGGGTPSVLSSEQLYELVNLCMKHYAIESDAEITLEGNPDDLNKNYLKNIKSLGVNRLSIGVQSFEDADLHWMNRSHLAADSLSSIENAKKCGFNNFSIDLMYGLPGSTIETWNKNLEMARKLEVPHLSCYALTVEEKTALHNAVAKQKIQVLDEEKYLEQMSWLLDWAALHHYEAYEISNFAKEGFRSRHNSSYWTGDPYIGFGPSAHSYDGKHRRWNVSNNIKYIQKINASEAYFEIETLQKRDQYNECIMIQLRRIEGIPISTLQTSFPEFYNDSLSVFEYYLKQNLLVQKDNCYVLTREGKFVADQISSNLFSLK